MMAIIDNNSDGNICSFPATVLALLPLAEGFLPGVVFLPDNPEGNEMIGFS